VRGAGLSDALNKLHHTADPSVIEIPLDGQLKVEDKRASFEAKGQAGLVLLIFVDDKAALEEVGFVAEVGQAPGAVLSELDAQHLRRVILTEVDRGIALIHQPLQQGEEILSVGRYGLGDGLLQRALAGEGAAEGVAGLDPFLSQDICS
jgi:hypothetical protein